MSSGEIFKKFLIVQFLSVKTVYCILNEGDAFIAGLQLMNKAERFIALDMALRKG